MTSTTETGHAKNAANFAELITFTIACGTTYNPSNPAIQIPSLQALLENAQNTNTTINTLNPPYSIAVADRETAFMPLNKLCTRVVNSLKVCDVSPLIVDDARTINRKIQGVRAKAKKTEAEKLALKEQGIEIKEISSSQMSYNNRLNNFDKLIKLLTNIPEYTPNEQELTTLTLTTLYDKLKTKNTAVINTEVPLSNARINRNHIFYDPITGLYDIAKKVKTYIKSVYGATSPQYKHISKLFFKLVKS